MEHIQGFLLRRIQGETVPEEGEEEVLESIPPGEVRYVEGSRLRVPARLENASVVVAGHVICEADVYSAQIVALGDVTVEGWCSHAVIVGMQDVMLHSAVYASIFSRQTLCLRTEARSSVLQAAVVDAGEAVLFGGQVVALQRIRVRQLRGAFGENALVLSIGAPYLQQLEQQYWRKQLSELREQLRVVQRELETLLMSRYGRLSEQAHRLRAEYNSIQEQLQQVELRSYGVIPQKPVIEVRENVPADTIISIQGLIYRVPSELLGVRFSSNGMRIVLESLPDSEEQAGGEGR